jgi:hypothetical protein
MWRRTVSTNRPVLMLVAPLGFLGVKEVNDFHVPVVQNLLRWACRFTTNFGTYLVGCTPSAILPVALLTPPAGTIHPAGTK